MAQVKMKVLTAHAFLRMTEKIYQIVTRLERFRFFIFTLQDGWGADDQ